MTKQITIKIKSIEGYCQLAHMFNFVCHNFQCDIVQKAYVTIHLN